MLSTDPGQDIIDYSVNPNRTRRGFLIDGGIIPGASGGPVVLKPSPIKYQGGSIVIGADPNVYLLGIIAETRFSMIQDRAGNTTPAYAGLGFAYSAKGIVETIAKFASCVADAKAVGAWPI